MDELLAAGIMGFASIFWLTFLELERQRIQYAKLHARFMRLADFYERDVNETRTD